MGIAHTVAKEKIFEPLRKRLGGMETWLGYLVSCPYCFSHWVSFALVPVTGTYLIDVPYDWAFVDEVIEWFLSSILVTTLAAFLRLAFFLADEKQALVRREKQLVDEEKTFVHERTEQVLRAVERDCATPGDDRGRGNVVPLTRSSRPSQVPPPP